MQNQSPMYRVLFMLLGANITAALSAACQFGLFDKAKAGASASELARRCKCDETNLYRLLRALAALDLFDEEKKEGQTVFKTSFLGTLLQSSTQESFFHLARLVGEEWKWKAMQQLHTSICTGSNALERLYGKNLWRYFEEENPQAGDLFNQAMKAFAHPADDVLLAAYDFSRAQVVADIGGGTGSFLIALLKRHPDIRGILFDRPQVIAQAHDSLRAEGLLGRCELVAGDFFVEVPAGADIYFLRQIVKDWDDLECTRILRTLANTMPAHAKILIAEQILGSQDLLGKLIDLTLLSELPGRERELREFQDLFSQANFSLQRILETSSPYKLFELLARPS